MDKGSLYQYWLTYGDWEGSRCLLQFDKPVTEEIAKEKSSELKVGQENIQGYTSLAEAEADAEKMEKNRSKDYGDKEVTKMRKVKASNNEDYGDTVVCCSVCGRIAIGERGEDYSQTVCVDCGNNEWKVLPFTKGANVRQDPNDGEVAQAGIRKKRVGASPNFTKVKANRGDTQKAVFIDGARDGYHPNQVERNTITVREMINALEEYPRDVNVFLRNDNGYTYGGITYGSIQGGTYDNDEVNVGEDIYSEYDDEYDDDEYEVAQAGIRKKRVGASLFSQSSALERASRCQDYSNNLVNRIKNKDYGRAKDVAGELSNTADFLYDELEELNHLEELN